MVRLAVLPQALTHRLALLSGICEDQAFFAPCVLEYVAQPRICRLGRRVRGLLGDRESADALRPFIRLRIRAKKVLHGQSPHFFAAVELRNDGPAPAAGREKLSGRLRIPDGRGQAHSPGVAAGQPAHALDQAEGLHPAVPPQQRMDLIHHDETQVPEQGRNLHMLVDHERLQRFRRDLQDPGGLSQELSLLRLRHVPVPAPDRNPRLLAQIVQSPELVVDQGLERCDIEHPHALRRLLIEQGQNREKSRLRLARRGRRRQKDIVVRAENGFSRRVLHAAQRLPPRAENIVLYKRRVTVEYFHLSIPLAIFQSCLTGTCQISNSA